MDFQLDDHKIQCGRRVFDVDIVIKNENIVIEYDGYYWHRKKENTDRKKSFLLKQHGWKVVRVRERPLKPITDLDVLVSPGETKEVINSVLKRLAYVLKLEMKGLDRYLAQKHLKNAKAAKRHIKRLQEARAVNGG